MALVWLCLAAFAAGAVNSVAGGGTLLTFPTLIWVLGGTPIAAVTANATSTVALLPGSVGSMWGYRREFRGTGRWIKWLLAPSFLGGIVGSFLLIRLSAETFEALVPWLILTATSLLALQPTIARWTGVGQPHQQPSTLTIWGIVGFQFLVAIYGGYFGAGIGILMLAALSMIGVDDFHRMNALKSLFGTAINLVAAAIFATSGQVSWVHAWPMTIAAVCGGFLGAALARRLDRTLVRRFVVGLGFALAGYYFLRVYGLG